MSSRLGGVLPGGGQVGVSELVGGGGSGESEGGVREARRGGGTLWGEGGLGSLGSAAIGPLRQART